MNNGTILIPTDGTGIRSATSFDYNGKATLADGFITVDSEAGGSVISTRSASEVINRGIIISYSCVAPVIDLRGGRTLFIN